MADAPPDDTVQPRRITATPRAIRPRSTPNAEVNAQERDKVLRDLGKGFPLAPNQSYRRGGRVDMNPKNYFASGGPQLRRSGYVSNKFGLKK